MKKIYLLSAIALGLSMNAQFTQNSTSASGIVSDMLSNGNFVVTADDFTLTQNTTITKIKVDGFQNASNLETGVSTGLIMYIYRDVAGVPESNPSVTSFVPVAKIDISNTSPAYSLVKNGLTYTYSVDIPLALGSPLALQQGLTYWLVFAPKISTPLYEPSWLFNWFTGTPASGNPAKIIDPGNAFGAGLTNWTNISTLAGGDPAYNALAFSIEGTNVLGTKEVYNVNKQIIYPNPASEVLTIKTDSKLNKVEIYDMTGRKVDASLRNNQVDVRNLQSGNYIIKITTKDGVSSEKFIKN